MNGYKKDTLNTIVLLLIVFLAVKLESWTPDFQNQTVFLAITLLTAKGFYELIIRFLFFIISHSNFLMRLYWGKLYIHGLWSYEYSRGGKKYFGIWRISQDLNITTVLGSGLNDDFSVRTNVRSVSPLLHERGGAVSVLNAREELNNEQGVIAPVFSKTTLTLDKPERFLSQVVTMRATTVIYGGQSNAHLHPNVIFRKHKKAKSDEDVINVLKEIIAKGQ